MTPLPWDEVAQDLDQVGAAITGFPVLSDLDCQCLRESFDDDRLYRSSVDLARHHLGEGRYRYFTDPLPNAISRLRDAAYPALALLANRWQERLGGEPYPIDLDAFLDQCAQAGQIKPTTLILQYEAGGWNALHQDLYGKVYFPFQLTVALSRPGEDFTGGENLFTEQRPRMQSRGTAVTVPYRHAVVFPTNHRPVLGSRGYHRATVRHGVSTVTGGRRFTLGVIFHAAQ
jgi:hypothetical protein